MSPRGKGNILANTNHPPYKPQENGTAPLSHEEEVSRHGLSSWKEAEWRVNLFVRALLVVCLSSWSSPCDARSWHDLITAARERTQHHEVYDGSYRTLAYPMGDVPQDRGVCTDLVIRAYRAIKVDLQVLVHEDMRRYFTKYPRSWGLRRADPNIDHRRVPNLQRFFERAGAKQLISDRPKDYLPGDLVTWMLPGNLPHIGIVSDRIMPGSSTPMILHNIGAGPVEDNILFRYTITGHYRYFPEPSARHGLSGAEACTVKDPRHNDIDGTPEDRDGRCS